RGGRCRVFAQRGASRRCAGGAVRQSISYPSVLYHEHGGDRAGDGSDGGRLSPADLRGTNWLPSSSLPPCPICRLSGDAPREGAVWLKARSGGYCQRAVEGRRCLILARAVL